MKQYNIAVLGVMGVVGTEMLRILEQRKFPVARLVPLDISSNAGKMVSFCGKKIVVEEVKKGSFKGVDIALFAAGEDASRELAPIAAEEGCIVIDNSSAWRMDEAVPLVVPEVNPDALKNHNKIIANPNCSTIIAVVPIKPLHDYAGVNRVIASTYQAVSGAGAAGLKELESQAKDVLEGKEAVFHAFVHQIAFNLIPHIDTFHKNGYTREEMKMFHEGRKILGIPNLMVNCTCVRVPVFRSHSVSVTIETGRKLTPEKAKELLSNAPGIKLVDDPDSLCYPMPIDTSNQDLIFVGRIRDDISSDGYSLTFWCCGDQIRKGAALNAVQIAETLAEKELV